MNKKQFAVLIITILLAIGAGVAIGYSYPLVQIQPTYTPNPTYTPWATYEPNPTYTPCITNTPDLPTPTNTPDPSPTPYPTYTPYPTQTAYPTYTPYPTQVNCWIPDTPMPPTNTPIANGQYYVATNGNDNDDGSSDNPWRTLGKAAQEVTSGNTVHVMPGSYSERVYLYNSGVTFIAEGSVLTRGFSVHADYVTVKNFTVANTSGTSQTDGHGFYITGDYNLVENNHLDSPTWGGIMVQGNNNIIRGNYIYRPGNHGMDINGRDNLIEFNEIERVIQYHPDMVDPPSWIDADHVIFFGSGHIFRGNYFHGTSYEDPENVNPHSDAFQTWDDSWHEGASDILFEWNVIDHQIYQAADEKGFGFMLHQASNITIRNNIIAAHVGVNAELDTDYVTVVNNVILYKPEVTDFWPSGITISVSHGLVANNIIIGFSEAGIAGSADIDYNLFWNTPCYNTPNSLCDVNPMFVDFEGWDFHLLSGSPAIDAGTDVGLPYEGSAPDMGIYEQ